jgi:hypothetical protein
MPKTERDPPMTAETFKTALGVMGWSNARAAKELGACSRQRIWDWSSGFRPVPRYIAVSLTQRVDEYLRRRGV